LSQPIQALRQLDDWLAGSPWRPRVAPWALYLILLAGVTALRPHWPAAHPVLYLVMVGAVAALLFRASRRGLIPELNLRFHWIALPVGVAVCALWILSGKAMVAMFPDALADEGWPMFQALGPQLGWTAMILRLLGMSIVVPLFEELFIRSLLLRAFHRFRDTAAGLVQIACDLPLVGDWLTATSLGERASRRDAVFTRQFLETPLGKLSVCGVVGSTLVFTLSHSVRDWPACVLCGLAYCYVVWFTNRPGRYRPSSGHAPNAESSHAADPAESADRSAQPAARPAAIPGLGLGPVVWAHGVTNAMLWLYTLLSDDWRFL